MIASANSGTTSHTTRSITSREEAVTSALSGGALAVAGMLGAAAAGAGSDLGVAAGVDRPARGDFVGTGVGEPGVGI